MVSVAGGSGNEAIAEEDEGVEGAVGVGAEAEVVGNGRLGCFQLNSDEDGGLRIEATAASGECKVL